MNEKYETLMKHFYENSLIAEELELLITELCNLNCKNYCSEGGPGKTTMTSQMIDAIMAHFKTINTLKILGGEPSKSLDIVERIYDNIANNEIIINEIWVFTNGLERKEVEKLCEILAYKPKSVNNLCIYVSRGCYHDNSIKAIGRNPQEADDNIEYLRKKFGRIMCIEKQWDEERPVNVGNARHLNSNPSSISLNNKNSRKLILFGENKVQKLVFSPHGYERPDFCNPEDVDKLSFGHIINDGMKTILMRGLNLKETN